MRRRHFPTAHDARERPVPNAKLAHGGPGRGRPQPVARLEQCLLDLLELSRVDHDPSYYEVVGEALKVRLSLPASAG
jgi:hypothetical protein